MITSMLLHSSIDFEEIAENIGEDEAIALIKKINEIINDLGFTATLAEYFERDKNDRMSA